MFKKIKYISIIICAILIFTSNVFGYDFSVPHQFQEGEIISADVFNELFFKNTDGSRSAYVMGHQYVDIDPYVVAGSDRSFTGVLRQDFFSNSHSHIKSPWGGGYGSVFEVVRRKALKCSTKLPF